MAPRRSTLRRVGTHGLVASTIALFLSSAPASAQPVCVGDCDGGGTVGINELITAVNISLGSAQLSACEVVDGNDSGQVEINELILSVNNSLNGCTPVTPGPTPTATPPTGGDCPLAAGRYMITQGQGGELRVSTFSPFPFPAGGMLVLDVAEGDENCRHDVVIPADGGFSSPTFCIPALGLSVHVFQDGCGIGQIASEGGADYTVHERGDTSFTGEGCEMDQETCLASLAEDTSVRVNVRVGDGTPDTCDSGSANAMVVVPVHTVTWSDRGQPIACPASDGTFDPPTDLLVVEFDQNLDFTTDQTTTQWEDLDGDGCILAGLGPMTFPPRKGLCMDLEAQTVTTVASGPVGSIAPPNYDLTFVTFLPNTYTGPDTETTPATCDDPPIINFEGEADRCILDETQ